MKIDGAFVTKLSDPKDAVAIVRAIISMAQNLDLKIIAEGVEAENHVTFLHALGCQTGQGYLFSRPVSAEDFVNLLTSSRKIFLAAE